MSDLFHIFFHINSNLSLKEALIIAMASVLMGIFIDITYRITHTHVQTDPYFHASLLAASLICAIVIYSASGIGVLGLAVVTALYGLFVGRMNSQIRDARIFFVWAIAAGVLCAEEKFMIAALMCVIIFFIFLFFRLVDNQSYLLTIKGDVPHQVDAQAAVFDLLGKSANKISSETDAFVFTITYKISAIVLHRLDRKRIDLVSRIYEIPGIQIVTVGKDEQKDAW